MFFAQLEFYGYCLFHFKVWYCLWVLKWFAFSLDGFWVVYCIPALKGEAFKRKMEMGSLPWLGEGDVNSENLPHGLDLLAHLVYRFRPLEEVLEPAL